jgi:hypothetical protein
MNLTSYLTNTNNTVNGKALRKPDLNLVAKLDAMGIFLPEGELVLTENPVTGYTELLNPFLSALIKWTYKTYATYDFSGSMNYKGTKVSIQTYDRTRMLVLSLDSDAYSNFLD